MSLTLPQALAGTLVDIVATLVEHDATLDVSATLNYLDLYRYHVEQCGAAPASFSDFVRDADLIAAVTAAPDPVSVDQGALSVSSLPWSGIASERRVRPAACPALRTRRCGHAAGRPVSRGRVRPADGALAPARDRRADAGACGVEQGAAVGRGRRFRFGAHPGKSR